MDSHVCRCSHVCMHVYYHSILELLIVHPSFLLSVLKKIVILSKCIMCIITPLKFHVSLGVNALLVVVNPKCLQSLPLVTSMCSSPTTCLISLYFLSITLSNKLSIFLQNSCIPTVLPARNTLHLDVCLGNSTSLT